MKITKISSEDKAFSKKVCEENGKKNKVLRMAASMEYGLEDYEYLLHHVELDNKGNEELHHCFVYDHLGNLFCQGHLEVMNGKITMDGKKVKDGVYHVIAGMEKTQDICWSNEEAENNKIKPKWMTSGMTFKEKSKEW